jgi:hypothetical protein
VSGGRVLSFVNLAFGIQAPQYEGIIAVLPVLSEIEMPFNYQGARIGVVPHPIPTHPGITERQSDKEQEDENALVFREPGQVLLSSFTEACLFRLLSV